MRRLLLWGGACRAPRGKENDESERGNLKSRVLSYCDTRLALRVASSLHLFLPTAGARLQGVVAAAAAAVALFRWLQWCASLHSHCSAPPQLLSTGRLKPDLFLVSFRLRAEKKYQQGMNSKEQRLGAQGLLQQRGADRRGAAASSVEHRAAGDDRAGHAGGVGLELKGFRLPRARRVVVGDCVDHLDLNLVPGVARRKVQPRHKLGDCEQRSERRRGISNRGNTVQRDDGHARETKKKTTTGGPRPTNVRWASVVPPMETSRSRPSSLWWTTATLSLCGETLMPVRSVSCSVLSC